MGPNPLPHGTLLVDAADLDYADFAKESLERTGHPVLVCHGPSPANLCPITTTGRWQRDLTGFCSSSISIAPSSHR